jgi:hypothetical protein
MTNDEQRLFRLERELQAANELLKQLRDAVAQLKQQQYGLEGGGGGGGGGQGVFYADGLSIAAHGTTSGVNIYQSWDGALASSTATIRNPMPDALTNTKRQEMIKNPDGSYSVSNESCSDE